jgi:hypothetical protein
MVESALTRGFERTTTLSETVISRSPTANWGRGPIEGWAEGAGLVVGFPDGVSEARAGGEVTGGGDV